MPEKRTTDQPYGWRLHYDDAQMSVEHLWPTGYEGSPQALCGHSRRRNLWVDSNGLGRCYKCQRLEGKDE